MGAAQNQRIGVTKSVGERLLQINAGDLLGDGVLDPSLLNQGNQQRTRLLPRAQTPGLKSFAVGMAAHRSLGSNHDNFLISRDSSSGFRARFNHSDHWNMSGGRNAIERQWSRRV